MILPANQRDSPGQPKRSLRVATGVRYGYYVQLVATKRDWMRVRRPLPKKNEPVRARANILAWLSIDYIEGNKKPTD